jgi:hypothetical protein
MKAMIKLSTLALLLLALPVAAQSYDWSNVGSVGIVQLSNGATFSGPTFTFSPFRTGTLTARYNVTNTVGNADKTPAWTTFTAAYTDNSALGSVTLRLFQVDKCNNTEAEICAITSSDDGSCSTCTFSSNTFDFANNFYYIQANINRTSTAATIQLHTVAIN